VKERHKILIVTPRSPFQGRGADEQDRLSGIEWFLDNGFEVKVITKTFPSDEKFLEDARKRLGIEIISIPYKFTKNKNLFNILKRLINPLYWDGAAFEYFDKEIQDQLKNVIRDFKPSIVWFDYTYLWPLYKICEKNSIPIITRSINFEPTHFLDEDGRTPLNYIRVIPKFISEYKALNNSDYFFSITPNEGEIYKKLGKTPVVNLPLRSLPRRIIKRDVQKHEGVKIGFMPSTYSVHHNSDALKFIAKEVLPSIPNELRKKTTIHITGNKLPDSLKESLPEEVKYEGFVPSAIDFWQRMDIALAPSLFGAGMQQKIFEPITLGVPTITSKRGLVGYPFICGQNVICAESGDAVAKAITELSDDFLKRENISKSAQKLSSELFSEQVISLLVNEGIKKTLQ